MSDLLALKCASDVVDVHRCRCPSPIRALTRNFRPAICPKREGVASPIEDEVRLMTKRPRNRVPNIEKIWLCNTWNEDHI